MAKKKDNHNEPTDEIIEETSKAEEIIAEIIEDTAGEIAVEEDSDLAVEHEELKNQHLRLLAEFDNFRKRTTKEREGLYLMAKADTVTDFLPVFDNLERAINQPTEDEAYKRGVEMIMEQFRQCMAKLGVAEIEAEGAVFDPEKHNAVAIEENKDLEKNTVAEVFQRGFEIDGKVIRHAVVKVVN